MRPWIKLATEIVADTNFRRLGLAAKATFPICLALAGRCDRDGLLAERTGPLDVTEIAEVTRLNVGDQQAALDELVVTRFLSHNTSGYRIHNWKKYQPKIDRTNAERQSRWYQRHRQPNTVTNAAQNVLLTPPDIRKKKKEKDNPRNPLLSTVQSRTNRGLRALSSIIAGEA